MYKSLYAEIHLVLQLPSYVFTMRLIVLLFYPFLSVVTKIITSYTLTAIAAWLAVVTTRLSVNQHRGKWIYYDAPSKSARNRENFLRLLLLRSSPSGGFP